MKAVLRTFMAFLLTLTMVLGMPAAAMAAGTAATDKGSITVNGLEEGVTVTAYQIAKAAYDDAGNFLGYEMTVTGWAGWSIGPDGSWEDPSERDLAELYKALGDVAAAGSATVGAGGDSAEITNLPVGAYLIIATGSESIAYGMMIGSVSYDVDAGGNWVIDNGVISVSGSTLWAKATPPVLDKTEHHTGGDETHGESANAGDEITFDITISNIPSYHGDYPEFEVDDALTGLVISDDELAALTVRIMDGETTVSTLEKNIDYTVAKISETEFEVNFVVGGSYTLNAYAGLGYTLVIEYQATVVDTGEYAGGELEHDNDANLRFSTNSYVYGNDGGSGDHDYEYSFALNAEKTDGENPLAGAVFALFTDEACQTPYIQEEEAVTAVSDSDGLIHFSGLAEGTYYMKETQAPAGYQLNQAVYKVEITASYNADGSIDTWSIVITNEYGETVGSAEQSSETGLSITNTKTGLLPNMGGMGTMLFTVIGLLMVIGALVGVILYRRRRA